uniref:Uncharacterized protein n=1 Tax=Solanum tuberosum TaxID=4113 RepID=M1BV13_SOLTU
MGLFGGCFRLLWGSFVSPKRRKRGVVEERRGSEEWKRSWWDFAGKRRKMNGVLSCRSLGGFRGGGDRKIMKSETHFE